MAIKKIAIVDDSQFMRRLIRESLIRVDPSFEISEFPDPEEALLKLPALAPDLITLDMLMPKLSGIQVLERLDLPGKPRVIVVTADIQKSVRERCAALGVQDFIAKPITFDKLQAAFLKLAA